jgi:hypothetical protein
MSKISDMFILLFIFGVYIRGKTRYSGEEPKTRKREIQNR